MGADQDDDDDHGGRSAVAPAWTSLIDGTGESERNGGLGRSLRARLRQWRDFLGRDFLAGMVRRPPPPTAAAAPPPASVSSPLPSAGPPVDPAVLLARVRAALEQVPPVGDPELPAHLAALDQLLADPPSVGDFEAIDLLHDCFPRGTRNSGSRALLAVALNLARRFGRPGRLPIAAGKAWAMLDADRFADQVAAQLADICAFISDWQANEKSFLILDFAEVELIEYLFETIDPGRHADLLAAVMQFKVLSARRAGLLRRMPARVRRRAEAAHGADIGAARRYAADTLALLDRLAGPASFAAVAAAATVAHAEVARIAERLTAALPPPVRIPPPLHPVLRGLSSPQPQPQPQPEPEPEPEPVPPPTEARVPLRPVRRRYNKAMKTEAVLRVLQGEPAGAVAADIGITPERLREWQDAFLDAGDAGLGGGTAPPVEGSIDELKSRLHALIETVEHLTSQIAQGEAAAPPAPAPPLPPSPPRRRRSAKPAAAKGDAAKGDADKGDADKGDADKGDADKGDGAA